MFILFYVLKKDKNNYFGGSNIVENIQIDLECDWKELVIEEIQNLGLEFENGRDKDSIILDYFTYLRKVGSPKRKEVLYSKEIEQTISNLEENSLYKDGIKMIKDKLESNESIEAHLSKRIDNLSDRDDLFNDWEVLHMHLGTVQDKRNSNFIERTGPLLFLLLKSDTAYFIDIYEHGDWTKTSILQTIYNNWPKLLFVLPFDEINLSYGEESLRIPGVLIPSVIQGPHNNEISVLPLGLGMATDNTPNQDVEAFDRCKQYFHNLEDEIKKLIQADIELKNALPRNSIVKLIKDNNEFKIIEIESGLLLKGLH